MKKKYNIIYSIGQDCACATYMKKARIRCCSGPLDWLTNTGFENRINLILNDFENFFIKEDFKVMPKPTAFPADKDNEYYENKKTGLYFWHDFPASVDFETIFPLVKEKYNKRIKRFYDNIANEEKVLLIYFSHGNLCEDTKVKELCNRVCEKFNKKIDFLLIGYDESIEGEDVKCYNLQENITIYKLDTRDVDKNGQPTTLGKIHLCKPIFNQLEIEMPLQEKLLRQFLYVFSKIICIFIFSKRLRKKVKDYLIR